MGEDEAMDEEEDVDNNVTKCYINITDSESHDNNVLIYSLAKRPPHQSLIAEKITEIFGTTNFLKISLAQFTRYHNNTNLLQSFQCLQATCNFLTQQQIFGGTGFNG